jgi:7-keto-8-aminopelargonate synthetase-like enzyme
MNQKFPELVFADDQINAIDFTLSKGVEANIIHCYADNSPQNGRTVRIDGKELLNCVSCSYFGLELDSRIIDAVSAAAIKYGTISSVSRAYLSAGLYSEFETLLDRIYTPSFPLPTSSTTLGHFALLPVMIQPGDVVLLDQQVHASVQMAATSVANKAKIQFVKHNDIDRLRRAITNHVKKQETNNIWYLGDGIYSMFGDFAPIGELIQLLDEFPNFYCYLDDAHGSSAFGDRGIGYVLSQCAVQHPKLIVAVSFGKCFGMGTGAGLIFPNPEWRRKVRTCGSTMIFSGPIPNPMLGAGIASAKIHLTDEITTMQLDLQDKLNYFHDCAAALDLQLLSERMSPIKYVLIGSWEDALAATKHVMNDGFLVNCCAYPAVAENHCGIRLTVTLHLTKADISAVLKSISSALNNPSSTDNLSG